jgi:hypothetical protein
MAFYSMCCIKFSLQSVLLSVLLFLSEHPERVRARIAVLLAVDPLVAGAAVLQGGLVRAVKDLLVSGEILSYP